MEETDQFLLERYVKHGDGEAITKICRRYANLVYSTCRRVLGNDAQAADAAQETFLQLLKNADKIKGSLGAWLHLVATRRSLDLVRQNTSRRQRESAYVTDAGGAQDSSWGEATTQVDLALQEIPDPLRELMVLYFIERKSMTQIAAAQGVSQPTVSRRIAEGLELLRSRLSDRGFAMGVVPLQGMLLGTHCPAPVEVLNAVSDIAMQGTVSCGAAGTISGMGFKALSASLGVVLLVSTAWMVKEKSS
ncbi:MAG TPA: sigma-70 family RNA polymerase sigma factor, partial [Clostridia bacterium]|nr:sigma-70 family RNA polymerase sigma factor [Clostridia bacterium]